MLLRPLRDTAEDAETVRQIVTAARRPHEPFTPYAAALPGPYEPADAYATYEPPEAFEPPDPFEPPEPPEPADRRREIARHLVRTDPRGGSWLAQAPDGRPVGVAQSAKREGTWALAVLAVVPEARGEGVGKALLSRAAEYGRGCLRGVLCCPQQPAAARVCRRAGFELHPAMRLRGKVDAARLDAPDGAVVRGTAAQRDLLDSVDRRLRGGAHRADHDLLLRHHDLFVTDDLAGSGYCYLGRDGTVELLAATSRRLATRLLTAALLSVPDGTEVRVPYLTAEQQWAVDVGLAAGLELATAGYVGLRGLRPPSPYVPSRTFA
ncbi:GNAT family N-acetyltransferase [Streptomyces armeniacus]|uniref:GNAT family N-acetyltransferase n=1 Tax=Streptomyces armeniacus TaxID=83291 RepID=A0A345XMB9_9ACTN|nr:GNAT family N-acetyltransferase [Streptomyces armeniacus]AXK32785.1 GNAT family N-acetyltransferase [Streptomyces armeniacus]